jgi:hypothetical protein
VTARAIRLENHGDDLVLAVAAGAPPLVDALGWAERVDDDHHSPRWQVTADGRTTVHRREAEAMRELRARAARHAERKVA